MKRVLIVFAILFLSSTLMAQDGLKVGDKAPDFELKNVDTEMVSLYDYAPAKKGAVVIFTCNHCPYAIAYEDRIIEIDEMYRSKGYPVIAVNPNDPKLVPEDSFDKMQERAEEKSFPFPYLIDETQEVYKAYGAKRTPHVYLLEKKDGKFMVAYIGTIDDNYKEADKVEKKYLASAIDALLEGSTPDPDFTKAIGCTIKDKNYKK